VPDKCVLHPWQDDEAGLERLDSALTHPKNEGDASIKIAVYD
jgi:hypothetical protein